MLSLAIALLLTIAMGMVVWLDVTRYIIPNALNALLLLAYPLFALLSPTALPWAEGLMVAGIALLIGMPVFAMRLMGGGDVKLLIVLGLWVGTAAGLEFFIYTALLGGLLALVLVAVRPATAWLCSKRAVMPSIPRIFTYGEPLPYGVAIALAFVIVLWMGKVPGLDPAASLEALGVPLPNWSFPV